MTGMNRDDHNARYKPTPAQIAAAAAIERERWSENETRKRAGERIEPWVPPGCESAVPLPYSERRWRRREDEDEGEEE